ncbi:ankyrin repeat-containing domain protein [Podospora didyma]|uniref:protein S-acyltransferase n=1 Tax=Podospora didyma TaxID=330526 RepID=A0AAE0P8K1_9PEZI|nr:ankyrin repeat-containing domain protein [Podospora didyma]
MDILGLLTSTAKFCWGVYKNYSSLPAQAYDLANDVRSLAKKLDWSSAFAEGHKEDLTNDIKKRLEEACNGSKATLQKAKREAERLKGKSARFITAAMGSEDVTDLRQAMRDHRMALDTITLDITADAGAEIRAAIKNQARTAQRPKRTIKVPTSEIPRSAPEHTKRLLMSLEDVDTRDFQESHHTPLHMACYAHDLRLAKLLLKHGANPAEKTEGYQSTALHIAITELPEIMPAFKESIIGKQPPAATSEPGSPIKKLNVRTRSMQIRYSARTKKWVDLLKSTNRDGQTPLHIAVEALSDNAVTFLCSELVNFSAGDAIVAQDKKGRTPLHVLASIKLHNDGDHEEVDDHGNPKADQIPKIAKTLLHWGAAGLRVTDNSSKKRTPLQVAQARGGNKITKDVLEADAETRQQDNARETRRKEERNKPREEEHKKTKVKFEDEENKEKWRKKESEVKKVKPKEQGKKKVEVVKKITRLKDRAPPKAWS